MIYTFRASDKKIQIVHVANFLVLFGAYKFQGWTLHTMYKLTLVQKGVLFEALVYSIHKGEVLFSLVCIFKNAIKILE